jgi:hypothetical protein
VYYLKRGSELIRSNGFSANPDAFRGFDEMRRNIEPGAKPSLAQNSLDKSARGAFTVGARDMDEAASLLRPAQGIEERANAIQAKLESLEFVAERVEEPDGFGIRSAQDYS